MIARARLTKLNNVFLRRPEEVAQSPLHYEQVLEYSGCTDQSYERREKIRDIFQPDRPRYSGGRLENGNPAPVRKRVPSPDTLNSWNERSVK